ncbi:MAG: LTA synthase family protein [Hyphomonadaceae bacterium]|nr:LTA synthase family protein [Hyphomonadaceae bacterium]
MSALRFVPGRYVLLVWVLALFLAAGGATRLALMMFEAEPANFAPAPAISILAVGLLYDLAAAAYVLVPFGLLALVLPNSGWGRRAHGVAASLLFLFLLFGVLFTAVTEFLFWNEFSSRFNFIAVDYLIYTREVVGNIRESYPIATMLFGLAVAALGIFALVRRPLWRKASAEGGPLSHRLAVTGIVLMLPAASFWLVADAPREALASVSARELAGNGYYEFARAFRSNDLDYRIFYKTRPREDALRDLRQEVVAVDDSSLSFASERHPLERTVTASGERRALNVVLVTMESLGADYVESLGGKKGLTPNLDRLARQGLMFTQIYATGLRTVRGLEAISLSIPPTPGHAVLMRRNNKGFQTLGGVFRDQGYEPLYIYGGYSYFDNMNDFFGGNGYTVIDRTMVAKEHISHETIWGIADEDLFKQVLREIDGRVAAGRRAFAHVLTTSNHRPFTYPSGRIDIPSGSGRDGAVKYADWAIGTFMDHAATRPWFKDTLFVFVADHTSHGRGRTDLPPENYRIPFIIYGPNWLEPRVIDTLASQIDVGPTILGLLNISYTSRFFGRDILGQTRGSQRALLANYLTVGYMEQGLVVELSPKQRARVVVAGTGLPVAAHHPLNAPLIDKAIAYYQVATETLRGP